MTASGPNQAAKRQPRSILGIPAWLMYVRVCVCVCVCVCVQIHMYHGRVSDLPRARREPAVETVETNVTLIEWADNVTKMLDQDEARGVSPPSAPHMNRMQNKKRPVMPPVPPPPLSGPRCPPSSPHQAHGVPPGTFLPLLARNAFS